ncbi:hypothetical protein J3F83DRAFT_197731 [Trichoderma novae-zelandiae]
MEHNRPNNRQLAVPQASASSSTPSSPLRHRPSFRDRFWTRTSANYDGEDDVVHEAQPNPAKKSAYVPVNAASGFARTASSSSPREQSRRRAQQDEPSSSSKDTGVNVNAHARPPLSDLAAGHLFVHTESDPEPEPGSEPASPPARDTTDFAAFIAAAQTQERVRRAASQRQGAAGAAARSSLYRDSGYYSSSNGGRHDLDLDRHQRASYSPSLPLSARAKGQGQGQQQPAGRSVGQRIAEYIKPPREESVASMRRP